MIKVISFKICPFFQYVTAMLEAKQIPYQVEYDDFDNCLFELSPNGKAPLLITESGKVLFDADAIVTYLETIGENLQQSDNGEDKALIDAWANYASKNYVPQCSTMRSDTLQQYQSNLAIFEKSLINIEKQLTDSPYFLGNTISKVDIAWLPILHRTWLIEQKTALDFFSHYPKIKNWQKSLLSLPWLKNTVSEDFETLFTDFYLSSGYLIKK